MEKNLLADLSALADRRFLTKPYGFAPETPPRRGAPLVNDPLLMALAVAGITLAFALIGFFLYRQFRKPQRVAPFRCLSGDCQNGYGVAEWPNGNRYMGDYLQGRKSGTGIFQWTDGRRYDGQWQNGRMHGQGIMTYPLGGRYEGAFVADRKEGYGSYTWPNGGKYTGLFRNNKRNGLGSYADREGKTHSGIWQDDQLVRPVGKG